MSQKDIDAGQVRIRIGPTKDRFPASPQNIRIVLRGRELTCWWNPRFNHDRERLGLIRVGTQAARDLLTAGEGLEVRFIEDSVHLN